MNSTLEENLMKADSLFDRCDRDLAPKVLRVVEELRALGLESEMNIEELQERTGCFDTAAVSNALEELRRAGLLDIGPRSYIVQ